MSSRGTVGGPNNSHERAASQIQAVDASLPVMMAFAFASNLTYAAAGALLRHWLAQGRRLLWFNRVMALALVATAAWMLWSAST